MTDNSSKKQPFSIKSLGPPLFVGVLVGLGVFITLRAILPGLQSTGASNVPVSVAPSTASYDALKGRWTRTEGGYIVEIRDVDPSGKMNVGYLNPRPINVAKAQASRKDGRVEAFIELRDTGYPGCTYTLAYDPRNDRLAGVYFQAAIQQRYAVTFERTK